MTERRLAVLVLCLALGACALLRKPHPDTFSFAVLGDVPYPESAVPAFEAMMGAIDAEPLAFAVHVGDFKAGGKSPCTDALYAARKASFDRSRHPFVYTPGDNEWTDCRRDSNGKADPIERLAKLREVFFSDAFSLGRTRMPQSVQSACAQRSETACTCPGLPENRLWSRHGVVFATVHLVGSNDNNGFDAANDAEQRCRWAANRAWMQDAFRLAGSPGQRGLVIFAHADPWERSDNAIFAPFLQEMADGAKRIGRPVLFVHGDSHIPRVDQPFTDAGGRRVDNLTRLEVPGFPIVGWMKVTVDPNDPDLFQVRQRY